MSRQDKPDQLPHVKYKRVLHEHTHPHATPAIDLTNTVAELPQGAGRGRILYLDAPSGLAGDMLVAALLDLGVPTSVLDAGLAGLELTGYELVHTRVARSSIVGRHFSVRVSRDQPSRNYAQIVRLITAAPTVSASARELALRAFRILAQAEATVHACAIEDVHFHEVGAIDSIIDIIGAAIAFDYLDANVVCSPLPLGRGSVRSQHGVIPLPAPATVLCLKDVPTYDPGLSAELVTPTGACLVAAVATAFGGWPSFRPERVGMGAGSKDWPDRANLLRVVLGQPEPLSFAATRSHGLHVVIEANVDDMTPEVAAYALQRALTEGALDAWTTAIGMKKGRSASTLSLLCKRSDLDRLTRLLLTETSSLGLRFYPVDRLERPRRHVSVETAYGTIDVKIAAGDGIPELAAPEYESCRRAAETHNVPIRSVYAATLRALETQHAQS